MHKEHKREYNKINDYEYEEEFPNEEGEILADIIPCESVRYAEIEIVDKIAKIIQEIIDSGILPPFIDAVVIKWAQGNHAQAYALWKIIMYPQLGERKLKSYYATFILWLSSLIKEKLDSTKKEE